MDEKKVWTQILNNIKEEITTGNFQTWFSKTSLDQITDEKIIIATPNAFISEQLKIRYLPLIESSVHKATGKSLLVEFKVDPSKNTKTAIVQEEDLFTPSESFAPKIQNPLNPKYTLENFVVGLTNNIAYAAAQAVAQNPGTSYNPLFFYGGTGVGKTHLMIGIGNAILKKTPNTKIIYCSSEKFTNDYVEAIQTRKMGDLRNKYRSADLLLVDDIQFFSGREQTQEEFFHTFNELTSKNSQIVLTSDRPPGEIAKIEDRLKSRFQGGLMVDIQLPDLDTRVAILRAKCLEKGEMLPEEVLESIASNFETNIRELEGKLIQIISLLKIQQLEPSLENVNKLLNKPSAAPTSLANLNHKQVLLVICNYFNIKIGELTGPKRNKELVLPRHLAMHILSEDLNMTVERIGQILGGRDHTTVMHGRDKIKGALDKDHDVQKMVSEIKQKLTA